MTLSLFFSFVENLQASRLHFDLKQLCFFEAELLSSVLIAVIFFSHGSGQNISDRLKKSFLICISLSAPVFFSSRKNRQGQNLSFPNALDSRATPDGISYWSTFLSLSHLYKGWNWTRNYDRIPGLCLILDSCSQFVTKGKDSYKLPFNWIFSKLDLFFSPCWVFCSFCAYFFLSMLVRAMYL